MGKTKRVPKYIKAKVERMVRLEADLVKLNMEVEGWLETIGADDGYDFISSNDFKNECGYSIDVPKWFYSAVEEQLLNA